MAKLVLHADNVKCSGCTNTIRRRVHELPGVNAVLVDPDAGVVSVEHDGSVDPDQVKSLLHRLGYPEHGAGGFKEAATSFLSCALGRFHGED